MASVSPNLPNASSQGQALESVVQQLQTLLPGGPAGRDSSSATIEMTRTEAPSGAPNATQPPTLPSSACEHISAMSSAGTASEARGAQASQASQQHTPAIGSQQNATGQQNTDASAQHSSSDAGKQDASDSSTPADPASSASQTGKPLTAGFPEILAATPALQTGATQTAQLGNAPGPQVVSPPNPADTPARSATDSLPSATPQAQATLPPLHLPDSTPSRLVNEAQLTDAAGQSEMRIAMQTDKLGAIELHARVSGDELGAAIIVEKRDAHAALAAELPALQQALSEKQLRVEQVALTQGSLHSAAGDAGANANAQNGQRGSAQAPRSTAVWNETQSSQQAAWYVPEQVGIFDAQGRLSVQA
jgi:flagellar hook-length control protein FliK